MSKLTKIYKDGGGGGPENEFWFKFCGKESKTKEYNKNHVIEKHSSGAIC